MAEPSPSQKEDVLERIKALQLSEDVQTSLARLAEVEPCESSPWKKCAYSS